MYHVDTIMDIQRREAELARHAARHAEARRARGLEPATPERRLMSRARGAWRLGEARAHRVLEALHLASRAPGARTTR